MNTKKPEVHSISMNLDEYGDCEITFDIDGEFFPGNREEPPEYPSPCEILVQLPSGETWYEDDIPYHLQTRIEDAINNHIDGE